MKLKDTCSLEGKLMTNLDSVLKSRDITLPTKVHLVKAVVFLVVMYRCESWAIKKAEPQRIGTFELWHWRRLLRVSWTARRANQSILREISPECSLEGLRLKQNLQSLWRCEELTHLKRPWCWERLNVGGEGDNRGWDGCLASPTQWTWVWVNSWSWRWTGKPGVLQSMGSQRVKHDWVAELTGTYFDLLEKFIFLTDYPDNTQSNNCMLACLILTSAFLSKAIYLQPFSKHFSIFMKWFSKF